MPNYLEFSAADWARIARDWDAWWEGTLERPLAFIEIDAHTGQVWVPGEQLTRYGLETPVAALLDAEEPLLQQIEVYGDAYPKWYVNFGASVVAAFLGSPVEYVTGTTWFSPLPDLASLAELRLAYDPANPWWQRVQAVTRGAVARWGTRVAISLASLGGNLDILASLRGTDRLLTDVIDVPEVVERLSAEITALWLRYYDALCEVIAPAGRGITCWAPCWALGRGYMLQSDFAYMISPRMFRRFVLPDLIACCNAMDYAFYHMDGKGQLPHLDQLLSIPNLRGVQWQPGDGQPRAEGWLDVLARIRRGGKLCQVYVTPTGALTIARELGGRGFLFHIVDELSRAEVPDFLAELYHVPAPR